MPHPVSRWTLRAKLLASVLTLLALTMLATGALTLVFTQQYLEKQLAEDLRTSLGRVDDRRGNDGRVPPAGFPGAPFRTPGSGDTLVLELSSDGSVAVDGSGVAVN